MTHLDTHPMLRILGVLSLALCLALPANAEPALTNAGINSQIIHRAFAYQGIENGNLLEGRIVYRRDKKILIRTKQGFTDGGSWRVKQGKLCTRITLGRNGKELCFAVAAKGDGSYFTSHGFTLHPIASQGFPGS